MPRKADGPEPAVRGEDGHGDAVERVADFGDVLGVSLFLGGEQVLLEARPVRQGMQGVGRPRDGGEYSSISSSLFVERRALPSPVQ